MKINLELDAGDVGLVLVALDNQQRLIKAELASPCPESRKENLDKLVARYDDLIAKFVR